MTNDMDARITEAIAEKNRRYATWRPKANEFCKVFGINPNARIPSGSMQNWEAACALLDGAYSRFIREEKQRLEAEAETEFKKALYEGCGIIATKVIAMGAYVLLRDFGFDAEWSSCYIRTMLDEIEERGSMNLYLTKCKEAGMDLPLVREKLADSHFAGAKPICETELTKED